MKSIFTLLLLLPAACAFAQQPVQPAPDAALEARVEQLEKKTTGWDKLLAHLPEISGYVQVGYKWGDDATSTFYLKRVRLNLTGNIVPKLIYRVQIEFASPKVVDAYLQYKPFTQLNVKLGQYKIPFSIENTEYVPLKFEFIEYPLALQKLMGFSENLGGKTLSATGREMGVTLSGGFFGRGAYRIVNYDLSIFNGAGINTKDDNKSKDLSARVTIRPAEGLQIAGSYYWGEFGASYLRRVRYGAGACYDRGPVVLRGEWIGGQTGIPDPEPGARKSFRSSGWYVMGGWHATGTLMPVARYDTLLADTSDSASRQTDYTLGLVWQPVKRLRCQLNYTYEDYRTSGAKDRNLVSVMLTGIF